MGRAPCCDKSRVKKGPWSPEEDTILINFLHKHGTPANWIALPAKAGLNRCGKSCRLRWLNYLRPDIKRGRFTETEDNIIRALYNAIGSRWSVIASKLQGRTDNDVKNHWNTKLKKKLLAQNDMVNFDNRDTTTTTSITGINNMVQFSCSFSKIENPIDQGIITSNCVDGALPYLMDVNYLGQCFEPWPQFSNDFGFNISPSTSHQQVSSSVLDNLENNYNIVWSGSGSEGGVNESGFLMEGDFGFEQPPPPPDVDVLLGGFGHY